MIQIQSEEKIHQGRLWFSVLLVLSLATLLIWRWADLQIEQFSHFSDLAYDNQVKLLPAEPPRGLIYDRNGVLLASNRTIYSLHVGSDFAQNVLGKLDTLTTIVKLREEAVVELKKAVNSQVYRGNIVLHRQMKEDEISRFVGWQFLFPEIVLKADLVRYYEFEDAASHVLGYVGRINNKDVEKIKKSKKEKQYNGAEFIGKSGVELINESWLRGALGSQEAQVDAHGRILVSRIIETPTAGQDLYLSLDWRLQQLAEQLLEGERGAVVLMDVRSGELLVLASNPRFDSNQFVFGISQKNWDKLNHSEEKPLIHRAIYGQYAPGSTIKPFMALSALQNGWRDLNYEYVSRGFFQLSPKHIFHDWKAGGHGKVDVEKSIVRSVNTFYYQLGHDIGIDNMHKGLSMFNFGKKTGIDLDNEKGGVLPSSSWKEKFIGEQWYPGDTVAASVGQGYLQATPLQMARSMAMIANGGRLLTPYLHQAQNNPDYIKFSPEYLQVIQEAMRKVTQPGGTASQIFRDAHYSTAGKTGTAQVSRLQRDSSGRRIKNKDLPKRLRDHAWFVGYAPAEDPQVSIAVIVENGGSGGRIAGPIVRQLLDAFMVIQAEEITNFPSVI